ncbi:MAG: SGNH/GDSL hydrolase family protein [Sphaerochaetaceae bacterium]|nr:SGNH/GDSL hydrolase family protein [Sphaerochaetaceae bacterium]
MMGKKIAFIGGSITAGSVASSDELCYAHLVYEGLCKLLGQSSDEVRYINAGIGGTTSQFGAARVASDVLQYKPDLVFVEFSVNDDDSYFFLECYEGLIRQIMLDENKPKIVLIHNLFYDTGANAQRIHKFLGDYYGLLCISIRDYIYPRLQNGVLNVNDLTSDMLHPNDMGHRLVSDIIIDELKKYVDENDGFNKIPDAVVNKAITSNNYESVKYWNALNSNPKLEGFKVDSAEKLSVQDVFKKGFIGRKNGDKISFELKSTKSIAIQYRKTINRPAPVARASVDGIEIYTVELDGNFEEEWGDCLYIQTLPFPLSEGNHKLEIEIISDDSNLVSDFYLTSILTV